MLSSLDLVLVLLQSIVLRFVGLLRVGPHHLGTVNFFKGDLDTPPL